VGRGRRGIEVTAPGFLIDLSHGARLVLDGREWEVTLFEPHTGRVCLRGGGQERAATVRELVNHPGCRPLASGSASPGRGRQPGGMDDLTGRQREIVMIRYAHLLEAETGYRSGDPLRAAAGEPRPAYDPGRTTLAQRRDAKAAELRALPAEEARALGLHLASARTLRRWAARAGGSGMAGCIDGHWLRRTGDRPAVTPELREALYAVHALVLHRGRVSVKTVEVLVHQYVRETFGPDVAVPSYSTLWRVWREWFGTGGSRAKYARSAARLTATGRHVVVHRPGQVVALDTTELAVLVRETVFGEPVPVNLTLALDVFSHSIVAFRLTLVSDTSTDVAMLLRDVMMPLPLREDWGEDMEWPYPGVPASLVAEFAGHRVAGLPFFAPETVTTDHGSVYKNHHLIDVQRVIGANILPARVLRPTDKQAVERCFCAIQSLLMERLAGYRGVDVADRGADPEGDAVLTLAEMEHLVATWVVRIWQARQLGEYAPSWDPGGRHSPNSLIAAAMAQGGFALQVPGPDLYFELLRSHSVGLYDPRGVKIRGLWYHDPVLDGLRGRPSGRGGKHKRTWAVRSDPRDRRFVFFQHPDTGEWHTLRWTGLPPDGEMPAFGDTRVTELLRAAAAAGLAPRTDAELLPLLLELIGGRIPVSEWPARMAKKKRTEHAREVAQGQAAEADRPLAGQPGDGTVVPLRQPSGWEQRAGGIAAAVDAERRRRRESAPAQPGLPARLGESRRSLFAIPDDERED
jgi:hypothetical protein